MGARTIDNAAAVAALRNQKRKTCYLIGLMAGNTFCVAYDLCTNVDFMRRV